MAGAKSALAGVLLPMLSDLSTEGATFLSDFTRDMEAAAGDAEKQVQVMADYISKGAKLIVEKLPEYIGVGKELIGGLLTGLMDNIDEILDMGLELVFQLLEGIMEAAPDLADAAISLVEKLMTGLTENGPELITSAVEMISHIVTGLAQAAPDLIPMAAELVVMFLQALVEAAPDLLVAGLELIYGIILGITDGLGTLLSSVGDIINTLVEGFKDKSDEILKVGEDIVQAIKDGITRAWDSLVTWFNNLWNSLFGDRNVNVDVNGTSSGGEGVDGNHATGLGYVPFDGYIARLHRGEMVLNSADAAAYRKGTNGPTNTVSVVINTKSITEADINMVVDVVNRKLGENL